MIHITGEIRQRMQQMIEELKQKGQLHSSLVERAFFSVPRHLFINRLPPYLVPGEKGWMPLDPLHPPEECLDKIYSSDTAVLLKQNPPPTSSSAPGVMAPMLEALELKEGLRVLEVGTGSGYNAALLSHIVGDGLVYTIENQPEVAKEAEENLRRASCRGVRVICSDGSCGHAADAPYNRIISTASIYDLPTFWREQLVEGGIIVAPLWMAPGYEPIVKLVKQGKVLSGQFTGGAHFMPLHGNYGYESLWHILNADKEEELAKLLEHSIAEDTVLPIQGKDKSHRHIRFVEFNAFVNLQEEHRAIGLRASSGKKWSWLSLWDRESLSLVSVWNPDWKIGVYGNEAMYTRLLELLDQWKAIGTPEIFSYRIKVFPEKLDSLRQERNTFVQFRSWNTLEISLPTL